MSGIPPLQTASALLTQTVQRDHLIPGALRDTAGAAAVDQVEISPEGEALSQMQSAQQTRAERLASIREAIQAGAYETPETLAQLADRLLVVLRAPG